MYGKFEWGVKVLQLLLSVSRSLLTFAKLLFMAKMPAGIGMPNAFQLKKNDFNYCTAYLEFV